MQNSSAAEVVGKVLTGMRERPTPATGPTTEHINKWCDEFSFQTFGEPALERCLCAAARFAGAMARNACPRWLTLAGPSGTGKTYLGIQLYRRAQTPFLMQHKVLCRPVQKWYWPDLLMELRDEKYHLVRELIDCNFVLLDDIGTEDKTGFSVEKLNHILGARAGKWTVLTTNFHLGEVGDRLDKRIASRMIRDGNKVFDMNAQDYALRTNRVTRALNTNDDDAIGHCYAIAPNDPDVR